MSIEKKIPPQTLYEREELYCECMMLLAMHKQDDSWMQRAYGIQHMYPEHRKRFVEMIERGELEWTREVLALAVTISLRGTT